MAQSILGGVLSFIAEGVIVFTPEGKIMLVNSHASLLLDRTNDELIGKHIDDIFALTFDSSPLEPREKIAYTLFTLEKVFTVPRNKIAYLTAQSGNRFPIFVSARSLTFENSLAGVLVFRDISVEKELESYKTNTAKRLSELTPFLQRISTGDFSSTPEIPLKEDEFTELLVGLRLMIEDLRDAQKQHEEYSKQLEKQVEEKTQEIVQAKTHIEAIIENLTSGLIECDDHFTIQRINRAAETLLGINREEVLGKEVLKKEGEEKRWQALTDVLHAVPSPAVRRTKDTATGLNIETDEITIQYPLERELQVITIPIAVQAAEQKRGFIKLIRDITREKNISKSKSEFISIAAHQLRTPLSAIKWTLALVLSGDEGPLGESQSKLLRDSYETNERMIQLVNDLLNVARIEEGRFGYEFKQGDIMSTIQNALEFVKIAAGEKNMTVSVKTPNGKPPLFVFDANKMMLALQNLLDNAIKYTLAGGKVALTVSTEGDHLKIDIQDTGIGVPEKQIGMLFTKFFRAENALRMQTSGSGMGLYLAKNIALRHGGSLSVESKEGIGSTFSLTLPLQEEHIPKSDVGLDEV